MRNTQLSQAKPAYLLLFICLGLLLTTKMSTRKVEAFALNSVAQAAPTEALTKGKINGKIVFTSNRKGPGLKLWTMNPDGSNSTQLTDESMRGPTLPPYSSFYDVGSKWSPDGTKIAFLSSRNYEIGKSDESHAIYVMNADGSDVRRVVIDLSGIKESPEIGSFVWSPDGTKFVFDAGSHLVIDGKPTTNIFTATVDGGNLVRLTNDTEVMNGSANWSPAGKQITFASYLEGTEKIYVINADGSNRHAIADGSYPSWSPDGSKILFVGQGQFGSCENYMCDQLYVVNPDGGQLTQLTHYAASYVGPKYSPDGTKILCERNLITYYVIHDPLFGGTVFNDRGHAIFVMDADGSNQINISNRPDSSSAYDVEADWQPLFAPANDPSPSVLGLSAGLYLVTYPNPATVQIVVTRTGNLDQTVSCDYQVRTGSITAGLPSGTLSLAPGEVSKAIEFSTSYFSSLRAYTVSLFNNAGNSTFIGGIKDATIIFAGQNGNPIDNSAYFVRQHYRDFLNREPDSSGWEFWTNNIDSCPLSVCSVPKRIDTSAAFFLSIEFQQTGYLVYRIYKASYGNLPGAPVPVRFNEFSPDTGQIGRGVVVGRTGWEQQLENNKQTFTADFVARPRFAAAYPTSMTPAVFVDTMFGNAGATPSTTDRTAAINEFGSATNTADVAARSRALRRVAENSTLTQQEFNPAFVLMEYFGYLRRNPNDPPEPGQNFDGYNFWLAKLNQFNGNFQNAEMVKAFISSGEYRQRFAP